LRAGEGKEPTRPRVDENQGAREKKKNTRGRLHRWDRKKVEIGPTISRTRRCRNYHLAGRKKKGPFASARDLRKKT